MLLTIGLCCVLYIYFVMSMAVYAAAQQDLARQVNVIQSDMGTLESQYLAQSQHIDLDFALAHGYHEPQGVIYARQGELARGNF
jgi:hypothetical protein